MPGCCHSPLGGSDPGFSLLFVVGCWHSWLPPSAGTRNSVADGGRDFAEAQIWIIIAGRELLAAEQAWPCQPGGSVPPAFHPVSVLWRKVCAPVVCGSWGFMKILMFSWQRFGSATLRMPRVLWTMYSIYFF